MNVGEQVAAEILRFLLQSTASAGSILATGVGRVILNSLENSKQITAGKNDIKKMAGKDVIQQEISINSKDLRKFKSDMKKNGIPYAMIKTDKEKYQILYLSNNQKFILPFLKNLLDKELKNNTKEGIKTENTLNKSNLLIKDSRTSNDLLKFIDLIMRKEEFKKSPIYDECKKALLNEKNIITSEAYLNKLLEGKELESLLIGEEHLQERQTLINSLNNEDIPFILLDNDKKTEVAFDISDREKVLQIYTNRDTQDISNKDENHIEDIKEKKENTKNTEKIKGIREEVEKCKEIKRNDNDTPRNALLKEGEHKKENKVLSK